jgi:hypothetical protein
LANSSASAFTSEPLGVLPLGNYLVTVFANGIPSAAFLVSPPGIAVEPVGLAGSQSIGAAVVGHPASLVFTIRNSGGANLTGLTITRDGADAGNFTVTASPTAPLAAGGSTTFTIQFSPTSDSPTTKSATIHIANNVPGRNPYDINLTGQSLSFMTDTDGDGLNDAAELLMSPLGFNWQVSQPSLVSNLLANANGAGLYTPSQVQALNVGPPLLTRNPTNGQFKLTIGVQKTTNISLPFTPFPMNGPGTTTLIDGQGKLEFQFTVPDNAAFFRLESH